MWADLVEILHQYAPTWLAQLPALCGPADLEALQRTVQGTTRARMLRELVEALEVLTAAQPLVASLTPAQKRRIPAFLGLEDSERGPSSGELWIFQEELE